MGALKIDNPLMKALIKIANMMIVSFFWLLCSIPIVTIMPSWAAMYHTTVKVIRGRGSGVVRDFFTSFKGAVKKGIPLTLIFVVSGALIAYALYIGNQTRVQSTLGAFYFIIGIFIAFIWVTAFLHTIPALSRFEGGIGMYIRMGLYFASKNLLKTLLRVILLAVIVFLVDFYPITLLILPGLYTDLTASGMEKLLAEFDGSNDSESTDTDTESAANKEDEKNTDTSSIELDKLLDGGEDKDE
jgi:uncharacterized membrane protein YesL